MTTTERGRDSGSDWVQVSRLGNPLVNEVIIPVEAEGQVQQHDSGPTTPAVRGFVVKPELAAS